MTGEGYEMTNENLEAAGRLLDTHGEEFSSRGQAYLRYAIRNVIAAVEEQDKRLDALEQPNRLEGLDAVNQAEEERDEAISRAENLMVERDAAIARAERAEQECAAIKGSLTKVAGWRDEAVVRAEQAEAVAKQFIEAVSAMSLTVHGNRIQEKLYAALNAMDEAGLR